MKILDETMYILEAIEYDKTDSDKYQLMTGKEVLEFIKEQRGKHFDPKLVDIFFDNLDDILKIKEEHQDI